VADDDNLSGPYLQNRQDGRTQDNLRYLDSLAGTPPAGARPAAAAASPQVEVPVPERSAPGAAPPSPEGAAVPDRQAPGLVSSMATQAVGGVRDAIVQAGQGLNAMTQWLRENTPVGALPVGPELQIKLPPVREAKGAVEGVVRSGTQFLTGFIPLFRAARGAGLAAGVAGATAGVATDVAVFDPHDPRISNMINEMAPALRNPVTEYLAAKPEDTQAEGRFKNALEGLALGGVADGVFRAVKAIKTTRALKPEELKKALSEAVTSEAGLVGRAEVGERPVAPAAPIKPKPLVEVTPVTPEQADAFFKADPSAIAVGDKALKIGWEQLGDQQGLEEVINRTTQVFRQQIDVARRGKVSDPELRTLAQNLGMSVEDFLSRRTGTAFNAEQSLALVNLLGASAKRLRGLASQVAAGNLDARQPMLDQLSLHAAIQEQAFGVRAEAGRALRVWGMRADGTVAHATALGKELERMRAGTTAAQVTGQLDAERLAHAIVSVDDPAKLAKLTRDATKPGYTDMFMELWINQLLSNPVTHVANVASNMLTAFWAIPERALAAQLSTSGQGVVRGEAGQMFWGLINGTMDAVRLAGKALREGQPVRPGTKMETYTRKAISGANLEVTGGLGKAIDLAGTAARLPSRFLMASDEFFKAINFRMELHAQAMRQATAEGLEGKALATRVATLVQDSDFLARVKPMADEFAEYQTFTNALGDTGSAISAFRDSHPAAKLVLPFLRTPTNIFKYIGTRTPYLNRAFSEVRADLAAGGARADLARSRVQLGGMVMSSFAVLAASGYVTGRGPRDPNLRREWLESHQPYSIKIGNQWVSLNRLGPHGDMIGMAADFASMAGELSEIDAMQVAAAAALSVSNNMLSKTYVSGLAEIMEAINSPVDKAEHAIRRLAVSLVPLAGASGVRQLARTGVPGVMAGDPTLKDARGMMDELLSRVPGFSSTVRPRMNLWGEPIVLAGGLGPDLVSPLYTKSAAPQPVSDEMVRQGVSISMPARSIDGRAPAERDPLREPRASDGVPLLDEEYDQYVKLAAGHGLAPGLPTLKEALGTLIASPGYEALSNGPDGTKAQAIRKIITKYRNAAQDKLVGDSTDLQAQIVKKRQERAQAAQGPLQPARSGAGAPAPPSSAPSRSVEGLIRSLGR
jgi:hypothetical protein